MNKSSIEAINYCLAKRDYYPNYARELETIMDELRLSESDLESLRLPQSELDKLII